MAAHWAIDFGTANTTVYNDMHGHPRVVHAPQLAKLEPLTQTPVIPSAVCVQDPDGKRVLIGQQALSFNFDGQAPGFFRGLKRYLDTQATRPLARVGSRSFSCQELVELYFRELLSHLEELTGEPVTDLTLTVPTDYFETYRQNLHAAIRSGESLSWFQRLLRRVGIGKRSLKLHFLDEPVAAALGYGVSVQGDPTIVAVDFGAGTMEMACVRAAPNKSLASGKAQVLAKQAIRLGGDDIDRWIMDKFVPPRLRQLDEWAVALGWEAERVKLLASGNQDSEFRFRDKSYGKFDLQGLRSVLQENGLFDRLRELALSLEEQLRGQGIELMEVDEVLLEGGSTLLPGFRAAVGEIFGLDKVREWLPFESVARGACVYASGMELEDFIHHDYALRILDETGNDVAYELLIPRGTRYPTSEDFVTRYYAANRSGQTELSLFICEVGRVAGQPVKWVPARDGSKRFAPTASEEHAFCICLNEKSSPLTLRPPGQGTGPRLRVTYHVNEERWLCVTVHDLATKVDLKTDAAVVKLR